MNVSVHKRRDGKVEVWALLKTQQFNGPQDYATETRWLSAYPPSRVFARWEEVLVEVFDPEVASSRFWPMRASAPLAAGDGFGSSLDNISSTSDLK
jgi:hypothetical protein